MPDCHISGTNQGLWLHRRLQVSGTKYMLLATLDMYGASSILSRGTALLRSSRQLYLMLQWIPRDETDSKGRD